MKRVTVTIKHGMVSDVEVPPGVSVHVIDYDVHNSQHEPVLEIWDSKDEIVFDEGDGLLIAASAVEEKVRALAEETGLDGTDILDTIAKLMDAYERWGDDKS